MTRTRTLPKLVIFDCDGVLVDTETAICEVLVQNLARFGLELTLEKCMNLFVGGTMAGTKITAMEHGAELPDDWTDEIYREMYDRLRVGVDVVSGIPALLDLLDAAQVPFCVASNGSEDKMKISLGQNDLWDRFYPKAMFSAHTLGVSKPDPGLFLAAVNAFGMAPQDCVVVEDSPTGALAAQRAGIRCIGYAPHGGADKLSAVGAEIISDMGQIPSMIGL